MGGSRIGDKRTRAYVRRLENPYATVQVAEATDPLHASQNPHAHDYYRGGREEPQAQLPFEVPAHPVVRTTTKAQFRQGCRQVFRQYIPPAEKGRLRDHHRAFIERNEDRSGEERFRILSELSRYDLSGTAGLQPHFNREREDFTAAKLAQIETRALQPR